VNELTLTGRVTNLSISHTAAGAPYTKFSLATDDRYFDRNKNQWNDRPTVWHDIIIWKPRLANNVYDTLAAMPKNGTGTQVAVTGTFSDNSYTKTVRRHDEEEDILIRRLQLTATQVSIPLDFVTATITPDSTSQERARARAEAEAAAPPAESAEPRRAARKTAAKAATTA
jgi:single-stranded DNA-binding protein